MNNEYEHQQAYLRLFALASEQNVELDALRRNAEKDRSGNSDPDRGIRKTYSDAMNEITREEFNAKLETIEVKMDARVETVSSKIDTFLAAQAERDKRLDAALSQISKDHSETKTSISSMKTTLIVAAVSTVIAIVLGVAGFNTALTSNMMSAFQLGKSEQQSNSGSVTSTSTAPPPASQSAAPSNSKKPAN